MTQAATASTRDAVEAAHEILAIGGNAVDAAVAAALASCVADPCNTGIGGYGGYMVVAPQGGPAQCVRFGLWAPSSMSPEMLCERSFPETGPGTSAVPNVVAGLGRALATFGSRDWATLVAPARQTARRARA